MFGLRGRAARRWLIAGYRIAVDEPETFPVQQCPISERTRPGENSGGGGLGWVHVAGRLDRIGEFAVHIRDERGDQIIAGGEVAVYRVGGHTHFPGNGSQCDRDGPGKWV